MLDSKEQVQKRLPIPFPKAKFGFSAELKEEAGDDAATATPSEGESEGGDPKVPSSSTQPLAYQIHALTTRFDAYWDEAQKHRVTLSQDMDALKAEMAIIRSNEDQITEQISFHTPSLPP